MTVCFLLLHGDCRMAWLLDSYEEDASACGKCTWRNCSLVEESCESNCATGHVGFLLTLFLYNVASRHLVLIVGVEYTYLMTRIFATPCETKP